MNAVETSAPTNSDSDDNSDDAAEYYQPISTVESGGGGEEGEEDEEEESDFSDADLNPNFHRLPNGWLEDGLSSLDLSIDEDEDEDGIEEAAAIESERAIERAFREDERRRSAPLAAETTVRVMDAMRGVSIAGGTPEWASEVAEEEWVDRLRRLRGQTSSDAGAMDHH